MGYENDSTAGRPVHRAQGVPEAPVRAQRRDDVECFQHHRRRCAPARVEQPAEPPHYPARGGQQWHILPLRRLTQRPGLLGRDHRAPHFEPDLAPGGEVIFTHACVFSIETTIADIHRALNKWLLRRYGKIHRVDPKFTS